MGAVRFETTRLHGLHLVGVPADLQHELISAVLSRELGPDYATLFAEFEVRNADTCDWFVDGLPLPVRVSDLPPAQAEPVRATARTMLARVRALADELERRTVGGRDMARALRGAAVFPPEDLFARNGKPIIVNWGYRREQSAAAVTEPIAVAIDLPKPSPAEPTPVETVAVPLTPSPPKKPSAWWSLLAWLPAIVLIGAIYAVLLPACGIELPSGQVVWSRCPEAPASDGLFDEGRRLEQAIHRATLDVARNRQRCEVDAARARSAAERDRRAADEWERRLPPDTKRGNTEISLKWDGYADLDLHVRCPNGNVINHSNLKDCGGVMIPDLNVPERRTPTPVEYVSWPGTPAPGTYEIRVRLHNFRTAPKAPVPFEVRIKSPSGERVISGRSIEREEQVILVTAETF